jgi:very-short-patch-repair endonuclease
MSDIRDQLENDARHRNHGVISRAEAIAAGLPVSQVDRRVRRRQWRPSGFPGWMIVSDRWDDPLSHLTCAIAALDGVAWRRSAMALQGLGPHPPKPEVLARQDRSGVARSGRYEPSIWTVTCIAGLRCLTFEDTVASMAGVSHPDRFDELVDAVILDGRTDWPRLAAAFRRVRRRGRLGSAQLGRVLEERRGEEAVPLSQWSRKFVRALRDAGLPKPQMEWRVEQAGHLLAQVDLAYPDRRYAIELDSLAYHLHPKAFEDDRRRDADLAGAGWLVRRFTWKQFDRRFSWVLRVIRADLDSRPHTPPPEL